MIFRDRFDAARILAVRLEKYRDDPNAVIVAIPRGGIEIGYGLAKELRLSLDVIFSKKMSEPGHPQCIIGAVSLHSESLDNDYIRHESIPHELIHREILQIRHHLRLRHDKYFEGRQPISLKNKMVILTDDGVATGKTLLSALELIRAQGPSRVVVAVPVMSSTATQKIKAKADETYCLEDRDDLFAIREFYEKYPLIEDEEAIKLLHVAAGTLKAIHPHS